MKFTGFILALFLSLSGFAQKNYLLIGRNTGNKTLEDSTKIRTFGFARNLNENPPIPGPTLYAKPGDSVTIDFWNVSQGASHTIHLHGLDVDQQNDGVPHLSFTVLHMEHGYYRFKAVHPGVYLYHCHVLSPIHVQAGMYGMLIIERNDSLEYMENGSLKRADFSFPILFSEVDTNWHKDSVLMQGHDAMIHTAKLPKYEAQYFLANGREQNSWTNSPIHKPKGDYLMRLANVGNYAIELDQLPPGSRIVNSDGRDLPTALSLDSSWSIYPGERYDIVFTAETDQNLRFTYRNLNTWKAMGQLIIPIQLFRIGIESNPINQVQLFPNPGTGSIQIGGLNGAADASYRVYNTAGQLMQEGVCENEIQLRGLKPGLYFIELQIGNQVLRERYSLSQP
ncbi:MAG: T9SS type A sorting domain-containing protein [Bacteroidetes bacterium]|nr:MAG: T9SS type A sorting domain-containing protein [Bacteroidota bacterium]